MQSLLPAKPITQQTAISPPTSKWIYSPAIDFWTIHGGGGLIVLPVVALSFMDFNVWPIAMTTYALTLGLPHLAATQVRLNLDADCRDQHPWLRWAAPAAIMTTVAIVLYALHMLPYLVFAWFSLQTWHANRQNFGIMRRYVRMAGSDPGLLVNRASEALVEVFPWAAVLYAALYQQTSYLGYPIVFPPLAWLKPLALPCWSAALLLMVAYLVLEARQALAGKFVPGRFLCCLAGCVVNGLAWLCVDDVSWGYLVVSVWHALQYIAYVHAFRERPPVGASPMRLTLGKHAAVLAVGGLSIYLSLQGVLQLVPAVFAVFHLSINFHHYLSDALIWRKPAPRKV